MLPNYDKVFVAHVSSGRASTAPTSFKKSRPKPRGSVYRISGAHSYIHRHTCIHSYTHMHICMHSIYKIYLYIYILHTYIRTYIHTYLPTYIHTHIHTYIHAYIITQIHRQPLSLSLLAKSRDQAHSILLYHALKH